MIAPLALATAGAAVGWWAWEKSHRKTHPVPPGLQRDVTLPHTAAFELYHNPLSLCSMKTRVCLAELGISYTSHVVDLIETGSYQTLSRAFLKVNPAGTVPVLLHEGHPVYESHEQIRYAAAHAAPHAPSDPAAKDAMERWIDRSSLTNDPIRHPATSIGNVVPRLTLPLFAAMIEKIPYRRIAEGLLHHFDKKRPVMFLVLKARGLEAFHRLTPLLRLVAEGREYAAAHLDELERQLVASGGPWILGHPHPLIDHGTRRLREAKAAGPVLRVALEGIRPR